MTICKGCGGAIVRDWTPTDGTLRDYHAGCRPTAGRITPCVACCFEGCPSPATRTLGRDILFPMCDRHAAEVVA